MRVAAGSDFLAVLVAVGAFALAFGDGLPAWARAGPATRPVARTARTAERIDRTTTRERINGSIRFPPTTIESAGPGGTALTRSQGPPAPCRYDICRFRTG